MRAPIHLWIIGVLSLLWNAGGAADYVMAKLHMGPYAGDLPAATQAFFDALPPWYTAVWAIGVWFSVIGSLLLLIRNRLAGSAFLMSLFGLLAASYYSFFVLDSSPMRDAGAGALAFTAAIYVVLILLWIYARAMTRNGVLR